NNDYRRAAGFGMAAAGAGLTAAAGVIAIVKAASGGAVLGGPLGAVIGIIGGVLIVGGTLVVAWFSDNEYQSFARHCFLSNEQDNDVIYPEWSNYNLRRRGSVRNQALALLDLISRFRVEVFIDVRMQNALPRDVPLDAAFAIRIRPGPVDPDGTEYEATFEVKSRRLFDDTTVVDEAVTLRHSQEQLERFADGELVPLYHEWRFTDGRLYTRGWQYTLRVEMKSQNRTLGVPLQKSGTIGGRDSADRWRSVEFHY
ncbi:MAG: hypothetical protein ACOCSK_03245, partial [Rhodothermales bacterium]